MADHGAYDISMVVVHGPDDQIAAILQMFDANIIVARQGIGEIVS